MIGSVTRDECMHERQAETPSANNPSKKQMGMFVREHTLLILTSTAEATEVVATASFLDGGTSAALSSSALLLAGTVSWLRMGAHRPGEDVAEGWG